MYYFYGAGAVEQLTLEIVSVTFLLSSGGQKMDNVSSAFKDYVSVQINDIILKYDSQSLSQVDLSQYQKNINGVIRKIGLENARSSPELLESQGLLYLFTDKPDRAKAFFEKAKKQTGFTGFISEHANQTFQEHALMSTPYSTPVENTLPQVAPAQPQETKTHKKKMKGSLSFKKKALAGVLSLFALVGLAGAVPTEEPVRQIVDQTTENEVLGDSDNEQDDNQQQPPKIITEQVAIPHEEEQQFDESIFASESHESQQGADGVKEITYEVSYLNSGEGERTAVSESILQEPITRIFVSGTKQPVSQSTQVQPIVSTPTVQPAATTPATNNSSNCDPNYSPCIPNVAHDLNCPDVNRRVTVIGTDRHGLDRDNDGIGCESY